jgi:hypothetical protein
LDGALNPEFSEKPVDFSTAAQSWFDQCQGIAPAAGDRYTPAYEL